MLISICVQHGFSKRVKFDKAIDYTHPVGLIPTLVLHSHRIKPILVSTLFGFIVTEKCICWLLDSIEIASVLPLNFESTEADGIAVNPYYAITLKSKLR